MRYTRNPFFKLIYIWLLLPKAFYLSKGGMFRDGNCLTWVQHVLRRHWVSHDLNSQVE